MRCFIGVLVATQLLSACAITSSNAMGPNGRPVHFIDGTTASVSFDKASELCPHGYTMLSPPEQTTPLDYVMTIECK
ncbi:hypothetical protein D3C77_544850 [compost metagenome]